jgi:GTPase SAR1 family protein
MFNDDINLITESDVEQKVIYPLLVNPNPIGFGFLDSDIFTKPRLNQILIGKSKPKYYLPDYLIMIGGIPSIVIEVKAPKIDLAKAYNEARLYASEINAKYPHKINACQKILVSNGDYIWAGYFDTEPSIRLDCSMTGTEDKEYFDLVNFCSKTKLQHDVDIIYKQIRGKALYNTPVSKLGGKRVQNEELVENTFGRTLVFENRNIFDPETEDDRCEIVKNAYISSPKREQHIHPIYSELLKVKFPSQQNSTHIATEEPVELLDKISRRVDDKEIAYSLILLIGNVGSGKSTFIRFFKNVFLENNHPELASKCEWVFINMNPAPLTTSEIYNWTKEEIIDQIKQIENDINFNSLETIKKLFRKQINKFEQGIGKLLVENTSEYNSKLYSILSELTSDNSAYLSALIQYLKDFHGKLPIVVLDNCDKRNREEQLLMFEVAQWLRTNFKFLVILPMRDNTYDNFKNEVPLDTVVKDLVFRIDPPDLLKVLQGRLDFISRINRNTSAHYQLESGSNVEIKKDELVEYFKCIMMAIRKDAWAMNIFYKLSNRNIRSGIQMFEDLCKSGHIKADEIFRMRVIGEDYNIPTYRLVNALIRKNRKYFNDEMSNFINLFKARYQDDLPDPFVRIDILMWLDQRKSIIGPNGTHGYHQTAELIRDVQLGGHQEDVILREVKQLITYEAIFSENQSSDIDYQTLLHISPSGTLHLSMLKDLNYLAACAEDCIYRDTTIMTRISRRISSDYYLDKLPLLLTAKDMIDYHSQYRNEYFSSPTICINDGFTFIPFDLTECYDSINRMRQNDVRIDKLVEYNDPKK